MVITKTVMHIMNLIWRNPFKATTKMRLHRNSIFSIFFLYRTESWTLRKAERGEIDATEICWRQMLSIPRTAYGTNNSIVEEVEEEPMKLLPIYHWSFQNYSRKSRWQLWVTGDIMECWWRKNSWQIVGGMDWPAAERSQHQLP